MYWIGSLLMLMSLSTIWQNGKSYGQKMSNFSGKKHDEVPTQTESNGEKPSRTECYGKMSTKSDILIENYGKRIIATKGEEGKKMKRIITELRKKQRMFEAIFGKTTEEENKIYSKNDEYKCLKERSNEIYQNDPPLSQLIDHLIAVQMNAKEALEYDNDNELNERINTLKSSLVYAVTFMANRHKIRLNSEWRGKEKVGKRTNDQRPWWTELANYYEEFQMDKIGKKCHRNSGYYGNKDGNHKENGQKEERFFRFMARTLETNWEGNAFSNGQNGEDDAIRRRKRRKRRMDSLHEIWSDLSSDPLIILLLCMIALYCVGSIVKCCRVDSMGNTPIHSRAMNRTTIRTVLSDTMPPGGGITDKQLSDYRATETKAFMGNTDPNNMCAICLSPFEPKTKILPMPKCNHIFHDECVAGWIRQKATCPICRLPFKPSATGEIKMTQQQNGEVGSSSRQMNGSPNGDGHHVVIDVPLSDAENGTPNEDGAAHGLAVDDHQEGIIEVPSSDAENGTHTANSAN